MGLYERTPNMLGEQWARLIATGDGAPDAHAFERALLALDAHRREIEHSLLRHQASLERLRQRLAAARTELARWQERKRLAQRHGRDELAQAATERHTRAHAHTERLRAESRRLQEAIAHLTVARERIEQALRRMRRHEAPALEWHDLEQPSPAAQDDEAIELAFIELELQELGGSLPPQAETE